MKKNRILDDKKWYFDLKVNMLLFYFIFSLSFFHAQDSGKGHLDFPSSKSENFVPDAVIIIEEGTKFYGLEKLQEENKNVKVVYTSSKRELSDAKEKTDKVVRKSKNNNKEKKTETVSVSQREIENPVVLKSIPASSHFGRPGNHKIQGIIRSENKDNHEYLGVLVHCYQSNSIEIAHEENYFFYEPFILISVNILLCSPRPPPLRFTSDFNNNESRDNNIPRNTKNRF